MSRYSRWSGSPSIVPCIGAWCCSVLCEGLSLLVHCVCRRYLYSPWCRGQFHLSFLEREKEREGGRREGQNTRKTERERERGGGGEREKLKVYWHIDVPARETWSEALLPWQVTVKWKVLDQDFLWINISASFMINNCSRGFLCTLAPCQLSAHQWRQANLHWPTPVNTTAFFLGINSQW